MSKKNKFVKWLPIIILVVALALVIYFRWYQYLSLSNLERHHQAIRQWTMQHYWLAVAGFIATYIIAVAISIPGATIFTVIGGFLFGLLWGTLYVVIGATIGACILFLAVRTSFGDWLASKASGWISRMEAGYQSNAFSYTLFLRLVPVFPFWVVNIVPALLDVRLRVYFLATVIGIIPGSFVYVSVGNGLDSLFAAGQSPDLGIIFKPSILIPLLGLGVLSLIPVIYKRKKGNND